MSYERGPQGIPGTAGAAGAAGATGATGATGSTEGLQYILTGTTVAGTITNYPNNTGMTAGDWTLASTISFTVPPNWSSNNSVCWDGWALYNFSTNSTNHWSVYYTTTSEPTEQALLGTKSRDNSIRITNQPMYLSLNLLIPSDYLGAGETINLRIYCDPNATVQLESTPQISGRVSVALN
jgi:hypothetical protein